MRWLVVLVVVLGCAGRSTSSRRPAAAADRFERVHRLIDLYDAARFTHGEKAREALGRELGFRVEAGPAATEKAIAAIDVEVDKVLAADRLHAGAQDAKTLLAWDGKPPAARSEVLQRMAEVKAIARGKGPMAPNARLRLAGYCWRALDDATRAPWRQRPFAIAHCLYALYDSDPDPYFDRDPDRRPPLPAWRDLVAAAHALLSATPGEASRALGDALGAVEKRAAEMPVEPVSEVMVAADAPLYDWAPIADASTTLDALRVRVQGDGRGEVALLVEPGAKDIAALAETARKAGASEIQLLVARTQRLAAPPGDYWHGKPDRAIRAAVIPISLAPLGKAGAPRSAYPVDFTGGLSLHLMIGESEMLLVGRDGVVAKVTDVPQLVDKLQQVRVAFPEQQALAVLTDPNATFKVIAPALAAAAWRNGMPFFRLGLAAKAPAVKGSSLAKRVALRAGASVAIVPDTLAARKPALLACYQDALEKAPALAGTVRVEPKNGAAITVGKADKRLAACVTAALGKALMASGAASAEVTFRVSGSR